MYWSTVRKYLLINLWSSLDIHSPCHRCRTRGNCVLNSESIGVSFWLEEIGDAVDVDVDVDVDIVEDMARDDGCRLGNFTTYVSRVADPPTSIMLSES